MNCPPLAKVLNFIELALRSLVPYNIYITHSYSKVLALKVT